VVLRDAAGPALFVFGGDEVEAAGDLIGHGLQIGIGAAGSKAPAMAACSRMLRG
jgi:hypothetical protein